MGHEIIHTELLKRVDSEIVNLVVKSRIPSYVVSSLNQK
jgi:hypothetical protein